MSSNESYCLAPHLSELPFRGATATIHPHSDDSWWFWCERGTIEQGPYASQSLAAEACQEFAEVTGTPDPPSI